MSEQDNPCPDCGSPRRWEQLPGGSIDAVCDTCGRRGAHGDLKAAQIERGSRVRRTADGYVVREWSGDGSDW